VQLIMLKSLYAGDNQLKSIPPEIGKLVKLQKLSLSNNKLNSLPLTITQLSNLTSLNIYGNPELNKHITSNEKGEHPFKIFNFLAPQNPILDDLNFQKKMDDDNDTYSYIVHTVKHNKKIPTLDELAKAIPMPESIELYNNIFSDKQVHSVNINDKPKIIKEPRHPPGWVPLFI